MNVERLTMSNNSFSSHHNYEDANDCVILIEIKSDSEKSVESDDEMEESDDEMASGSEHSFTEQMGAEGHHNEMISESDDDEVNLKEGENVYFLCQSESH